MVSSSIFLRHASIIQALNDQNILIVHLFHLILRIKVNFHHHHQPHLNHYFDQGQTSLLMHTIQCKIRVRPRYFIKQMRLT